MERTKYEPMFEFTGGRFIDPAQVGSTIQWKFTGSLAKSGDDQQYISASGEIALSDCSRRISWGFDLDDPESLDKLDVAIAELQEARRKLALAIKRVQAKKVVLGIED